MMCIRMDVGGPFADGPLSGAQIWHLEEVSGPLGTPFTFPEGTLGGGVTIGTVSIPGGMSGTTGSDGPAEATVGCCDDVAGPAEAPPTILFTGAMPARAGPA